jgi:hypothetical protein
MNSSANQFRQCIVATMVATLLFLVDTNSAVAQFGNGGFGRSRLAFMMEYGLPGFDDGFGPNVGDRPFDGGPSFRSSSTYSKHRPGHTTQQYGTTRYFSTYGSGYHGSRSGYSTTYTYPYYSTPPVVQHNWTPATNGYHLQTYPHARPHMVTGNQHVALPAETSSASPELAAPIDSAMRSVLQSQSESVHPRSETAGPTPKLVPGTVLPDGATVISVGEYVETPNP